MKDEQNIYTWLDRVRERPSMNVVRSIRELEDQIWGYYRALRIHRIEEPVPQMVDHFRDWIRYRTGWSLSCGWAAAIERHRTGLDKQLTEFFSLVDEYRQFRPVLRSTVRLKKHNQPTGRRIRVGWDGRIEQPRRVDIVRLVPAQIHFLKFHYPDNIIDNSLMLDSTVLDAKRWVREEFQVKRDQWQNMG